ncbi:outer membrane beta-barrel protein [Hoeflea poritis]|uniref:Outer membrane beta-barrel protein n=1 Tax=Hoeflea poritis TaxID=2993659 RepID=A0ABT4VQY9_9HYPH|nr:outer membrane beta-barrel protein [Hoeflea poritis]MDA4847123.1 outer membrane beta-barrel protein [Hoeflea poritis]
MTAACLAHPDAARTQTISNEDLLLRGITDDDGLSSTERRRLFRAAERIVEDPEEDEAVEEPPLIIEPIEPVQDGDTINPRTEPVATQVNRLDDPDPFAPVGIRVGTFVMRPSVTQQIAYEHETDGTATVSRTYSRTVLDTEIESDWSRHQLIIGAEQVIDKTISGAGSEDPQTTVNADLRLDISSTTTANLSFDYQFGRENQTDANAITDAIAQAEVHTFDASASLTHLFGTWRGTATIDGGRTTFGSAELSGGTFESLSDRDENNYTVTLRAGLETGSAHRPFIEGDFGQIIYDDTLDSSGFDRSSRTYGLRAGVATDFGEKLTGEIAVGYAQRDIDDSRLEPIKAFTVDGFATWSPRRGTDVLMGLSTALEDSTTADESGSVYYAATAEVTHRLRTTVEVSASGFIGWRDYVGTTPNQILAGAGAGMTWWLNRYFAIDGGVTYQRTFNDGGTEEDDLFVGVGVKMQR